MAEAQAETQVQGEAAEATLTTDEFQQLLQKEFRPQTDAAKSAIQQSVQTLAEQALVNTALVSTEVVKSVEAMIAEIDRRLTEQLNNVLHHPDFQQLEGAWRGLQYLVNNTETDEFLKIRVFNITKKDLHKTLRRFKGTA